MNYITAAKNTKKLSETELRQNISGKASWHYQYKDSAWIYIGGLPYDLTEGDIICVFSQYGEVVNLNLPRDKKTGKSKGFCFLCYEDQRSTILAVDNLNTIKLCGRIIRVDHVEEYKVPKNIDKLDDDALRLLEEGCGPESSVVKSLLGQQESSSQKDDVPKREQEVVITESQQPWRRSSSPQKGNERTRHQQEGYRRAGEGPSDGSCNRHQDSKSSRHRERKEDDYSGWRDRKHSACDKRRREEKPRDYDKERSRTYDNGRRERSRHDERSKHRDRSRSRDRDRKLWS